MCVLYIMWIFTNYVLWVIINSFPDAVHFRKSTFFNVLTKSQAAAENFPFCTIDPNESRVPVPDERFDFLCRYHKPARSVSWQHLLPASCTWSNIHGSLSHWFIVWLFSKVPAFLNVVDIAGLVKGAHSGQGLGNAFLSHISACDGIFHMTRELSFPFSCCVVTAVLGGQVLRGSSSLLYFFQVKLGFTSDLLVFDLNTILSF